ncbi:hypothetical protein VNO77_04430 [Canavalia gladiata]|uniref:Uncharacterized protein n=1 Tax=Canavalia gladiata TaxID=3824 RepID=A0AAN9MWH9_CANGL
MISEMLKIVQETTQLRCPVILAWQLLTSFAGNAVDGRCGPVNLALVIPRAKRLATRQAMRKAVVILAVLTRKAVPSFEGGQEKHFEAFFRRMQRPYFSLEPVEIIGSIEYMVQQFCEGLYRVHLCQNMVLQVMREEVPQSHVWNQVSGGHARLFLDGYIGFQAAMSNEKLGSNGCLSHDLSQKGWREL